MTENIESILPLSSTELVSLNTKIPRKTREQLEHCIGILQTTSKLHVYTLQKVTQLAIENLFDALTEYMTSLDRVPQPENTEKVIYMPPHQTPQNDTEERPSMLKTYSGLDIEEMKKITRVNGINATEERPSKQKDRNLDEHPTIKASLFGNGK